MSDPRRLFEDPDATDFERELVGSWKSEGPSPAARDKALGLATVAVGAAAAGSLATKAATSTGAFLKWLLLGGAVVAVGGGAALVATRAHDEPVVTTTTAPEPKAPIAATVTATTPAAPASVAVDVGALPNAPSAPASVAVDVGALPNAPSAPSTAASIHHATLAEQIAAMDSARSALASGDAPRAIALLADYERRFPHGAFVEEAEALRVEALAKSGDSAGAKQAAERFLAAYPASPHASRVRALGGISSP